MNYRKAKDLMFAAVKSAWTDACEAYVGRECQIRYDRLHYDAAPPTDDHWARASTQESDAEQSGFSASNVRDVRRYAQYGTLFVQLFCPEKPSRFGYEQDLIAMRVRVALRRAQIVDENGCRVVLNNIRILPLLPEGGMMRVNIVAAYEYQERN